jgi:peptide/nickel transport system ATP-binding protein
VLALRRTIADGVDAVSAGERSYGNLKASLREMHDLPGSLSDPDAEATLDDALVAVANGNTERARTRLAMAFASPCEAVPSMRGTEEKRRVACHLY